MTRINCVPVEKLHTKHLVAEYRELPRVFKLAEAAAKCGNHVEQDKYVLGPGRVRFSIFGSATASAGSTSWLQKCRSAALSRCPDAEVPAAWRQDWEPSSLDILLNQLRIEARKPKGGIE
jgi:deoxyribonuclease (pyrimidine dimer)